MAAAESKVVAMREDNPWAAFQQLFAGVAAGVATTLCMHPLDLIKTRMQSLFPCFGANGKLIGIRVPRWVGLCGLRDRFMQMRSLCCRSIEGCRRIWSGTLLAGDSILCGIPLNRQARGCAKGV
jgi:Mitochondrial carrier protein